MARLPFKQGVTWPDGTTQDSAIPNYGGNTRRFTFSTSTGTPPAAGTIRFNNATYSSVTNIYVSAYDFINNDLINWPVDFEQGSRITIFNPTITSAWVLFMVAAGGISYDSFNEYYTIPVTYVNASGTALSSTAGRCALSYDEVGGGGSGGDASTNTSTSVDDEIALFSGTGGKTLKRATSTGILKAASGVIGTSTRLGEIDALSPSNDDIIQQKAGAWANRTMAQLKTDLTLNNVDNTSDATKNSATATLTNKRITKRVSTTNAPGATPSMNTDNFDVFIFTGINAAITSMTTNLTGTPTDGQTLWVAFTDNGTARAITWDSSFEASGNVALPTTTVISTRLDVGFVWNATTSKWRCVAKA